MKCAMGMSGLRYGFLKVSCKCCARVLQVAVAKERQEWIVFIGIAPKSCRLSILQWTLRKDLTTNLHFITIHSPWGPQRPAPVGHTNSVAYGSRAWIVLIAKSNLQLVVFLSAWHPDHMYSMWDAQLFTELSVIMLLVGSIVGAVVQTGEIFGTGATYFAGAKEVPAWILARSGSVFMIIVCIAGGSWFDSQPSGLMKNSLLHISSPKTRCAAIGLVCIAGESWFNSQPSGLTI